MPGLATWQHIHNMGASSIARRLFSTPPHQPPPPSQQQQQHQPSDQDSNSTSPSVAADGAATADAVSNLPSSAESRRSALNLKFSAVMDNLQARALNATQTLNDVTGYSAIESIKADNESMERSLHVAQERVRAARTAYKTSNTKRAATQREVTTLLARKDSWSPTDLERFTELYRTDHVLEGEVASAQTSLTEAEADEQSLNQRLNAGILKRYHEEQIWSDRIRRASTWGTWGLMGMNFVLFVILQFFAEPWRRKRMVRAVVQHEKDVLDGVRTEMETLKADLENKFDAALKEANGEKEGTARTTTPAMAEAQTRSDAFPSLVIPVSPMGQITWAEFLQDPSQWKLAAIDLCSDRQVALSMRDASTLVFQGVVAGAAIAGSVALLATR